jgi:hypothetical protein
VCVCMYMYVCMYVCMYAYARPLVNRPQITLS